MERQLGDIVNDEEVPTKFSEWCCLPSVKLNTLRRFAARVVDEKGTDDFLRSTSHDVVTGYRMSSLRLATNLRFDLHGRRVISFWIMRLLMTWLRILNQWERP